MPDVENLTPKNNRLWKTGWLIAGQVTAMCLLLSWLLPSSHQLWVALDTCFFWQMNGSMVDRSTWQYIMALANHRMADLVPAILVECCSPPMTPIKQIRPLRLKKHPLKRRPNIQRLKKPAKKRGQHPVNTGLLIP